MSTLVRAPGLLVASATHAGRILRGWSRSPAVLAPSIAVPVVMLAITLLMFGRSIEQATGVAAISGLTPLMICSSPLFGGTASAAAMVGERLSGITSRFAALPGSRSAPLAGRVVAETVRGLVGGVAVLLVGFALGFRITAGAGGVALLLLLITAIAFAFGLLMTLLGSVARTPEATVATTPLIMIMMFLNTGFIPVEAFPTYLQPVVSVSPLTGLVQALDAAATGQQNYGAGLLWIGGIAVVAATLLTLRSRTPRT